MWMKHEGLYSSSRGFVFMPTSSLNNESLKMLRPLLPTHPHQSVRAAYPKHYSIPLMLACVSGVIGGRGDKREFIFCARVAASSQNPLNLRMCAYLCMCSWAATEYVVCARTSVCEPMRVHICVWTFISACLCAPVISSLLLLLLCPAHLSVCIPGAERVCVEARCQILFKCSSHSYLMIVHHFHS